MGSNTKAHWCLFLMGGIYMVGELGHFILGTLSKDMAQEIHYGEKACLKNTFWDDVSSDVCSDMESYNSCINATTALPNGTEIKPCTWDYNGLGLEYHLLAGPSFVAIFTVTGLIWGSLADTADRRICLTIATMIFSLAIMVTSFSKKYWHLVLLRSALALGESGCSPLASGIIADLYPQGQRAAAMSLFNWGIYIGFGLSYTIGTYVPKTSVFQDTFIDGWRSAYFISGIPGIFLAILFYLTAIVPKRSKHITEASRKCACTNDSNQALPVNSTEIQSKSQELNISDENLEDLNLHIGEDDENNTTFIVQVKEILGVFTKPALILLLVASCVRHAAGFCWGYNSALYFQTYYPDYDASIWLTMNSIFAGAVGAIFGGYLSDRLVNKLGIAARVLVLAISQLVASPFALALFFLEPPYALISLIIGYAAAEMWFGVMLTVCVELVPSDIQSKIIAIVLFCINNIGGNTPVLVDPVQNISSYRTALIIFYPGALLTSSILFFGCWVLLKRQILNQR